MKESYHVILALVNIFQVQSAKLKEIHDFIIIPTLPYHAIKNLQNSKLKVFFNLSPELHIFLKL